MLGWRRTSPLPRSLSLPLLSFSPYSLSPYSLSRSLSQRKVADGEARIDLLCQNMHTLRVAQVRLSYSYLSYSYASPLLVCQPVSGM
jgi:hypothetical protein